MGGCVILKKIQGAGGHVRLYHIKYQLRYRMEQNMQGFTNTADRNETISYIEECGCQTEAAEADCVKTAMAFARQCHQGQTRLGRDGKVPYYDEHILGVYHILKDECHVEDETVLVAALLHDTVEDTDCTFEDIEKIFGTDIRDHVYLLSKLEGETFSDYSKRLFDHAPAQVVMIKLADRLHNLRTILFVSNRKWIQRKVNQTHTDILDRLEQVKDNLGEDYASEISMLKDKIIEQLAVVQAELDKKRETIQ